MTTNSASGDAPASSPTVRERLTLRTVMSRHKGASAGAIALLFVLVAVTVSPAFLSSSGGALGDSTSCSGWGSASQAQQTAYSHLYLNEYGALPSGARDPNSIKSAVSNACIHAAYLGEADDVSVVAAIKHQY
jgi:hypothetical protein